MSRCVFPRLTPSRYSIPASGGAAGFKVIVVPGVEYELRCSAPVRIRMSGGPTDVLDLRVEALAPLLFFCDVKTFTCAAATATDAVVWLREVPR